MGRVMRERSGDISNRCARRLGAPGSSAGWPTSSSGPTRSTAPCTYGGAAAAASGLWSRRRWSGRGQMLEHDVGDGGGASAGIRVVVVGGHTIVREGLKSVLGLEAG